MSQVASLHKLHDERPLLLLVLLRLLLLAANIASATAGGCCCCNWLLRRGVAGQHIWRQL